MKLLHSFKKELMLSSKSYFFYVEVVMALILLVLLVFIVPENFSTQVEEYVYLNLPQPLVEAYEKQMLESRAIESVEDVEVLAGDDVYKAKLYKVDGRSVYLVESRKALEEIAEKNRQLGVVISLEMDGRLRYDYYLQGYESERFRSLYALMGSDLVSSPDFISSLEDRSVIELESGVKGLSDRDNLIPIFLTVNGSLMGLFMIASYISLDRKEGIIQAYAVTPVPIWNYLLSKAGVIVVTSILSGLIVLIPVMGLQVNYGLYALFMACSGFFTSALGLVVISYYKDIVDSFGVLYGVILLMVVPNLAYMVPGWSPAWIRLIPTYYMLESFKELLLPGDILYVLMSSVGFIVAGMLLFGFANYRFKRTLLM